MLGERRSYLTSTTVSRCFFLFRSGTMIADTLTESKVSSYDLVRIIARVNSKANKAKGERDREGHALE